MQIFRLLRHNGYRCDCQFAILVINNQLCALRQVARNNRSAEQCLDMALQESLERTSAVNRIVAVINDILLCGIGQFYRQLLVFQTLAQSLNQQVNDTCNILLGQRLVEYNLIQTVEEFRTERAAQQLMYLLEVRMIMVFLKSTVRPCESVIRPSSSTCSRTLNTSGCAFSISSNRTTEYGFLRTASVSWPPSSYPVSYTHLTLPTKRIV